MKESYIEGVASRDDPESCARVREGTGEAFDRGTCGPGIEPRNHTFQDEPDINATYLEMAQHYGVVVLPARPRRPKDDALDAEHDVRTGHPELPSSSEHFVAVRVRRRVPTSQNVAWIVFRS
ncbi:MAG: hypothetical protein RL685_5136 [Pseudomonadota bacterium]|jgi:hypothetical protein